jgi:uncharacterized protein
MGGEVGHFEIPADEVERARKFYSAVFGWKMTHIPEMNYTMAYTGPVDSQGMPTAPGYIGGGIGPREGVLKHPLVTIVVDEIQAALKLVESHGGKVLQPQQPIGDGTMGSVAYIQDTEGNVTGLYQAPMGRP